MNFTGFSGNFRANSPGSSAMSGGNICPVDIRIDNGVWNDYGQDVNKVS